MKIEGKTLKGVFQERLNRFLALARVENTTVSAFLPNPGRMHELLTLGAEVILREARKKSRKTSYDLIGVLCNGQIVSIDSRVPNRLVLEALRNKDLEGFSEYDSIKPEYAYGHARFDFLLANEVGRCLLEVKSCTLVRDGIALFPDAKTTRGRRHMMELARAKEEGYRSCVLFMVQRTDMQLFSPNDDADPEFGETLRDAAKKGVEVLAYSSGFSGDRVMLKDRVRVKLG